MKRFVNHFMRTFHNHYSNYLLRLSVTSKCRKKKSQLFRKAYYHNVKYLENLNKFV
jgi:hypothetical protein